MILLLLVNYKEQIFSLVQFNLFFKLELRVDLTGLRYLAVFHFPFQLVHLLESASDGLFFKYC